MPERKDMQQEISTPTIAGATHSKAAGFLFALIAAVTYGLNPFFGIPLYQEGLTPLSVLFYRFFFASLLLGGVMLVRRKSFYLPRQYWLHVVCSGILVALTCLFWFMTFRIMDSGMAATLLFVYPVMVAFIMFLLYGERLNKGTIGGILFALAGVAILCQPGNGGRINIAGLIYIFLSALTYAIYIVAVKQSRLKELDSELLTFYALLLAVPCFLAALRGGADLQMLPSWNALGHALGLGLFPSLCSFLFAALAIRRIGPTRTSVLGALEPVTAVLVGIFFFHEPMTWKAAAGIVLILVSVCMIICLQDKKSNKEK
jgi:drug/metabolite transporter (DMT)-like permease